MKAIRYYEFGEPASVLKLEDVPDPEIKPNEVLVKITARSINPSDIYTIKGTYGIRPRLPAIPGNEASGVIVEAGSEVKNYQKGQRVTLMLGASGTSGTWKELIAVRPEFIIKTPNYLSDAESTTIFVNYLTAWILAFEELDLKEGEKLLMTAANSHLGRAMLQLSAWKGFKVVATVRQESQKDELLFLGAQDVIVTDTENIVKRARRLTNAKGFNKAIDAVGGKIGSEALLTLAPKGKMIVYGLMSNEPITVTGSIIFTEATIRGFWLVKWIEGKTPEQISEVINKIGDLFKEGILKSHIDSSFDLTNVEGYISRTLAPGKKGKVVITSS